MNIYGILKKNSEKKLRLYGCACSCYCGSQNSQGGSDATGNVTSTYSSSGAEGETYE